MAKWVRAVRSSPGFVFHIKAFGLFTAKSCPRSSLPAAVKALLTDATSQRLSRGASQGGGPVAGSASRGAGAGAGAGGGAAATVTLAQLGDDGVDGAWRAFHDCLAPLDAGGCLGLVVFQFHLSFGPSDANRAHIRWCRARLDKRFTM